MLYVTISNAFVAWKQKRLYLLTFLATDLKRYKKVYQNVPIAEKSYAPFSPIIITTDDHRRHVFVAPNYTDLTSAT